MFADRIFIAENKLIALTQAAFIASLIVLAPQSANVHCIDLQTGARRWQLDRGLAHYAVTAGNELVLLVGPRDCTALRIDDAFVERTLHALFHRCHEHAGNRASLDLIDELEAAD